MNNLLYNLSQKYIKNKSKIHIIIQIICVYHKLRSGAVEYAIKDTKFIEKNILPLLDELKIFYIYKKDYKVYTENEIKKLKEIHPGLTITSEETQTDLFISNKKIPKNFNNSPKNLGKFLGYICASNNFADNDIIKEGRLTYYIIEEKTNSMLLADVCNFKNKKTLMKGINHYVKIIKRYKDILEKYNLKLKFQIWDEKTKIKTDIN